ncbi:glycosyltransferase [Fragilaria crotonensis]|nr:glycosyltransferase [Fragilaria crotonensis]
MTGERVIVAGRHRSTLKRGRNVVLVAAGLVLLSLLRLEFLSSLRVPEPFESNVHAVLPDNNEGVVRRSLGSTQSAGGRKQIPLDLLTDEQGQQNISCPPDTKPIFNSPVANFKSNHRITLVIHQTFKSRCVTDDVYQLSLAWKALGVPYYFHDDAAIDRLILSHNYKEFPHLQLVWEHCITKPVVKTDLWRLLLLYEYGGIYADLDTKPISFQPTVTIRTDDEMYAVADLVSRPSFHFMASMPRHPVQFLTLQQALHELLFIPDTGFYCPAVTTGPDALEKALEMFLRNHDPDKTQFHEIKGGSFTFHGMGGHTVRRDGTNETASSIVQEFALPDKEQRYKANEMVHYRQTMVHTGESCFDIITKHFDNKREKKPFGSVFDFF